MYVMYLVYIQYVNTYVSPVLWPSKAVVGTAPCSMDLMVEAQDPALALESLKNHLK